MLNWLTELRRSSRTLVHDTAFSLPVFVCLALTIGSATAVFSVVDTVLLKPLPFPEAGRIRSLFGTMPGSGDTRFNLSATRTAALVADTEAFESVAWWRPSVVGLTGEGDPRQLSSAEAAPTFFDTLGIQPVVGGGFAETARAGERVAYLSEALWLQDFDGDPNVVGRRMSIDDLPTTVAGIVPASQVLPPGTDIWLPLLLENTPDDRLHSGNLNVIARLADGVNDQELSERLERIAADMEARYPAHYRDVALGVQSLRTQIIDDAGQLLVMLLVAVGLLLVLGSANVANLLMVRNRRQRLMVATRAALGGSRATIVRWLLSELLLLGGLAAAAGSGLAAMLAPSLLRITQIVGPGMDASVVDPRTLAFTTLITLVASLTVGIVPALRAARLDLASVLRVGGARTSDGAAARRSQGLLIASQAAMGVVLVVTAGQTLGELHRLSVVDEGYRTDGLVTIQTRAPESRYPETAHFRQLFTGIRETLETVPGVEQVGASSILPVGDWGATFSMSIQDRPPEEPNQVELAQGYLVLPNYLETMGIRLLAGRTIGPADNADGAPVVVVSQSFAARYWPGEVAVGKRLKRRTYTSSFPWTTVVGVVEDVSSDGVDNAEGVAMYLPHGQTTTAFNRWMTFVVRSDRPLDQLVAELRGRIAAVDADLPLARVATIEQLVSDSLATRRLASGMLGVFALIGLTLLATGTYGVVAFAVAQRRAELGLRRALGAEGSGLILLVLRGNVGSLAGGTITGLVTAASLSRLVDPTLLPPAAPTLYVLAAVMLVVVGLVASLPPALRAARLDPTLSLRGGLS